MLEPGPKRTRDKYSRVICLGCRARRIRCDLPNHVDVPELGEFRTVQTPCRRCNKLNIPCVIRQTVLGRPTPQRSRTPGPNQPQANAGDDVPRSVFDLSPETAGTQAAPQQNGSDPAISSLVIRSSDHPAHCQATYTPCNRNTPLLHKPRSPETVLVLRALDTLRYERVENEWFRHLPAHFGHTPALDLSIQALVTACAYSRGLPKITSTDCYRALALALDAVQTTVKQSTDDPNDHILASTALLVPFEGVIKKNGIQTRLHVNGLAAILVTRRASHSATQLARDIVDFHACESSILACLQSTPSPFETIPEAYFTDNARRYGDSAQARLKALGNELFIRLPRLVNLVRSLRFEPFPQQELLPEALHLSEMLLELQDYQAEERLLRNIEGRPPHDVVPPSPLYQSVHFPSIQDYEALAYYWQGRLSVLRLHYRLSGLLVFSNRRTQNIEAPRSQSRLSVMTITEEMLRLVSNILMTAEYAGRLPLFKHHRMFAHAMVVVWGVMMDVPAALSYDHEGDPIAELSDFLMRKVNAALPAIPKFIAEDMDVAADIFVGGQLCGRFSQLYGL